MFCSIFPERQSEFSQCTVRLICIMFHKVCFFFVGGGGGLLQIIQFRGNY